MLFISKLAYIFVICSTCLTRNWVSNLYIFLHIYIFLHVFYWHLLTSNPVKTLIKELCYPVKTTQWHLHLIHQWKTAKPKRALPPPPITCPSNLLSFNWHQVTHFQPNPKKENRQMTETDKHNLVQHLYRIYTKCGTDKHSTNAASWSEQSSQEICAFNLLSDCISTHIISLDTLHNWV